MNLPTFLSDCEPKVSYGVTEYYLNRALTLEETLELSYTLKGIEYTITPDKDYNWNLLGTIIKINDSGSSFEWNPQTKIRLSKGKR